MEMATILREGMESCTWSTIGSSVFPFGSPVSRDYGSEDYYSHGNETPWMEKMNYLYVVYFSLSLKSSCSHHLQSTSVWKMQIFTTFWEEPSLDAWPSHMLDAWMFFSTKRLPLPKDNNNGRYLKVHVEQELFDWHAFSLGPKICDCTATSITAGWEGICHIPASAFKKYVRVSFS